MTTLALPLESGVWSGATQGVILGGSGAAGRAADRPSGGRDFIKVMLLFDEGTLVGHATEGDEPIHVHGWWGEPDLLKPPVHEFAELGYWETGEVMVRLHLERGGQEAVCHLWSVPEGLRGFWRRETN